MNVLNTDRNELNQLGYYLKGYPNLKDFAEIHRGIEWNISLIENRNIFISFDPKPGFSKGLDKVPEKIEPFYAKDMHDFLWTLRQDNPDGQIPYNE